MIQSLDSRYTFNEHYILRSGRPLLAIVQQQQRLANFAVKYQDPFTQDSHVTLKVNSFDNSYTYYHKNRWSSV